MVTNWSMYTDTLCFHRITNDWVSVSIPSITDKNNQWCKIIFYYLHIDYFIVVSSMETKAKDLL